MAAYSKFIVVIVGLIVMAVKQFAGIDLGDDFASKLSDLVIMVLTAVGVLTVSNKTE